MLISFIGVNYAVILKGHRKYGYHHRTLDSGTTIASPLKLDQ